MDSMTQKDLSSDDLAVFDELAKAQKLYEEYVALAAMGELSNVCEPSDIWPHQPDLPLSLTIAKGRGNAGME